MESISVQRRAELARASRDTRKLELHDYYGADKEDLKLFLAGDLDAVDASYRQWAAKVAEKERDGRHLRRVRLVSEPLSDYQRMSLRYSGSAVDAGEDLRWLPRRLASTVLLPGNDMFVLDGRLAMFNVLDGNGERADIQFTDDPAAVARCLEIFEAAYSAAIPHHEYRPV
ncbi:DUF6879 family protein [Streptosporangium sp. NPDC049376]|uniref:DUF6879 family protein n=1 Tax=Streptosporangium sp. NPDC049376 TaxID=3366192 RepID=UPI0037AD855B